MKKAKEWWFYFKLDPKAVTTAAFDFWILQSLSLGLVNSYKLRYVCSSIRSGICMCVWLKVIYGSCSSSSSCYIVEFYYIHMTSRPRQASWEERTRERRELPVLQSICLSISDSCSSQPLHSSQAVCLFLFVLWKITWKQMPFQQLSLSSNPLSNANNVE